MTVRYVPVSERKWGYRPSHHVFELVFLIVAALVAVPLVLGAVPAPDSTASFLSGPLLIAWGWMLTVGSLLGLTGLLWAGRLVSGLVLERMGLTVLAGAVVVYILGVIWGDASSPSVAVPVAIVGAFGLACALRAVQLAQDIRDLVTASSAVPQVGNTGEQAVRDHFQAKDAAAEDDG